MRLLRLGEFDHALGCAHLRYDLAGAVGDGFEPGLDLFRRILPDNADALCQCDIGALDAAGAEAYPITAPTWVIVYKTQTDQAVADALKGYLNFFLTAGQELAPTVGYAPLPAELQEMAIAQLDEITVG